MPMPMPMPMPTSDCPSENALLAFAQRHLPSAQQQSMHAHIDRCPACRVLVADLLHSSPPAAAKDADEAAPDSDPVAEEFPAAGRRSAPFELSELGAIDEYRLVRPLGRGAMGLVYLAQDTLLERMVAIKLISPKRPDSRAHTRFLGEARAIARLQHPNVVSVYRVGQLGSQAYLVCEYVEGSALDQLKKPLPWQQVLSIATGLARGLAAAHRSGVLHRDIKPSGVVLGFFRRRSGRGDGLRTCCGWLGGWARFGSARS